MQVTGMGQQYLSLRAQLLKGDSDLYKGQVSRTPEGDAVSSTARGAR